MRTINNAAADPAGYARRMLSDLRAGLRHNKRSTEKLADAFGIQDRTAIKELTELAIVKRARELAHMPGSIRDRYMSIVELYNIQANLSHRTSNSVLLQQYSTPAPISYLAGVFCRLNEERLLHLHGKPFEVFEPSAGNGLLTVAGKPSCCTVNEIDELRRSNLMAQDFREVIALDGSAPFPLKYHRRFDAVLTNPPFGSIDMKVDYDGYRISSLEQLMALRALDCMANSGRAAIIIGGHTKWDEHGRIQAGRNRIFFNYLYAHYNVAAAINIDGHKLYSRQGTGFNVRLILIDGRKRIAAGHAPLLNSLTDTVAADFEALLERVMLASAHRHHISESPLTKSDMDILKARAIALELEAGLDADSELGMPYTPASDAGKSLDTQVPDSMGFETHAALRWIQQEVGGDVDNLVRDRLGYRTLSELGSALSAEQIDAVAVAIYNIEGRNQGMIIGDQTGIGKGRVAAAVIRYACMQGLRPVFITEKPNLFSDIYRDLKAIGSAGLVPFIVNSKESKTDIKDEDGVVIYTALTPPEQQAIFESLTLPARFDFTVATYSQFNSPLSKPVKPGFLSAITEGSIMILDEAHNSSGSSNTGSFLKSVVKHTKGVVFLSATFAKRPDNMPIYAMKTCMSDCALSDEGLVEAINSGGVALQEVIAAQLVSEGQMLRRERSYEGIEVNYLTMDDKAQEHNATADIVTGIMRRIIAFQSAHIAPAVQQMDKIAAAESKEVTERRGTEKAGVDNMPYFSKVFNVINQMLFAIKAEAVADRAILRLREGKKPAIAFSSTMGAFLEAMENDFGMPLSDSDVVKADFSEVLQRGIDGVMKITVRDARGNAEHQRISVNDLSTEGIAEYYSIMEEIKNVSTGLCISPIDVLIGKIKAAGYSVAEVTGRKLGLHISTENNAVRRDSPRRDAAEHLREQASKGGAEQLNGAAMPGHSVPERLDYRPALIGTAYARRKENTNDAFRRFNNNEVDVLLINQSGSTGASAHAIPTSKVPAADVRQRVMIVLQAELDINTEVQKRGRINRTGQILKPIYDYLTSTIPAEQRLMMMLQKKLKSLDANTSSNQKQSSSILDVPDFLNKYGDKVVKEFLFDNPELNELLDDPLGIRDAGGEGQAASDSVQENAAQKVSGRVAVLNTDMQKAFYDDISQRYNDLVSYLKQAGEYDLELEAMNLQAETVRKSVISVGTGGGSPFGEDVHLELVEANVLRNPYSSIELSNILKESLSGQDTKAQQRALLDEFTSLHSAKLQTEMAALDAKYTRMMQEVPGMKAIRKIAGDHERQAAIREQEQVVAEARELAAKKAVQKSRNIGQSLLQYLEFFHTGKSCAYPVAVMGMGIENIPAVFLGFIIDRRKSNPFAPSAVKLRFAIASGLKYIELPASMRDQISPIISAGVNARQYGTEAELLEYWAQSVAGSQAARKKRYIITGNLLQALGNFKGRLIDYTTLNGGNEKGLLMPEGWNPNEQNNNRDTVTIPLAKAGAIIRSMPGGSNYKCSNGLVIAKEYIHRYKLYVSASRQGGGDIYLDAALHPFIERGIWEKQSDKMVAFLPADNATPFLSILSERHPGTMQVARHQLEHIDSGPADAAQRRHYPIRMPAPAPTEPPVPEPMEEQSLAIRALALELEMEMEMELY